MSYCRVRGGEAHRAEVLARHMVTTKLGECRGLDSFKDKTNHGETVVSQRLLAACCGAAPYLRAVGRLRIALVNVSCHVLGHVTLMNE